MDLTMIFEHSSDVSPGAAPCPFCGSQSLELVSAPAGPRNRILYIACQSCAAHGPIVNDTRDGEGPRVPAAEQAWNSRCRSDDAPQDQMRSRGVR